ncbi:MAG: hypothetical protein IJ966_03420 [Bacilli bacterium]|nr:hypothetical protein [Bacilli bacterium]
MKLIKMKCESCGATLDVNKNLEKITCNYCGAEILIDDEATKVKRVEDAKLKARKDNHEQSLKERNDILEQEVKEKKVKEELNSVDNFKKGKFSKVLLVFFAIAVLFFFIGDGFLVKFLTLVQAGTFICAWLMGMKILKEPFKGLKVILAILGFVLIIPIINAGGGTTTESEKIVWEDIYMHEVLPEPNGKKGQILTNSDENLSIYIHKQSEEDYNDYVEECKKKGFTIDSESDTSSYDAYNKDGYKLRIYYSDYSKEYNIDLESPLEVKENAWTDSTLSKKLPKPKSTKGKVESDSSKYYTFYASDMSLDDFNDYVEDLKEAGFDIDHYKTDKSYSAKNKDGYKVSVSYEGFNIIRISISLSEEDTDEEETTTEKEDKTENKTDNKKEESSDMVDGMRKEFKEAMDSYEEFIDEYIAFMKKYADSNGTDAELLKDYTTYMSKYSQMVESFEKWEDDDLNSKEEAYYIKVQSRVSKKLLEATY